MNVNKIIEFANLFEHHFKVQRNTGETSIPQKLDSETTVDACNSLHFDIHLLANESFYEDLWPLRS